MARWKNPVEESPPFSIVREVLTLVSWVERSIFRETSLMTNLELISSFPRIDDARSKAAMAARRRETGFILRWKRIVKDDYVESPQWIQRKRRTIEPTVHWRRPADSPKDIRPSLSKFAYYFWAVFRFFSPSSSLLTLHHFELQVDQFLKHCCMTY